MSRIIFAIAVGLLLPACGTAPLDGDADRAAIVDGEVTTDLDALVAIALRRTGCEDSASVLCSGTLIAADAVLSAAHCFDSMRPGLAYEIFVGDSVGPDAQAYSVREVITDPAFDSDTRQHDVAILWLVRPVDGVLPQALPESNSAPPDVGARVALAGFGATRAGSPPDGLKRVGIGQLSERRATVVSVLPDPSVSCVGDSGGPLFTDAGELIGVASSGDAGCSETSVYALVAPTIAGFIEPVLEAGPVERPPSLDACGGGCAMDADCPAGFVCVPGPQSVELQCALPGQEAGRLTEACTNDGSCRAGFCAWSGTDPGCQCYEPCDSEPSSASSKGCAVRHGEPGTALIWLLALTLWLRVRRFGS